MTYANGAAKEGAAAERMAKETIRDVEYILKEVMKM